MTLFEALFRDSWQLDRYPYEEAEGLDEVHDLHGFWEPFAFERAEAGLVLVWTRRRLTLRERLSRWRAERNRERGPDGRNEPAESEPETETDGDD